MTHQDIVDQERVRQQQQYARDHLTKREHDRIENLSEQLKGWGGRLQDAIDVGQVLQSSSYGHEDACEFVAWLKSKKPLTESSEGFKDADDAEPDKIGYAMMGRGSAETEIQA